MKKIFSLLAISLVLALPIVSCTADDTSAKQAQTDREELEIPGDEDQSNIQYNQLALYVSATSVPVGTLVSFTTVLNGVDVTDEVDYYVNNLPIGGSSISSHYPGTFNVQAKLEGYMDSPIKTVVYGGGTNPNPNPNPNPTGNFIFNGTSYNMVANLLVFNGAFLVEGGGAISSWTSIVVDNTQNIAVAAAIDFTTPFTITDPEQNLGQIVYPNGTNEVYQGAQQIIVNEQEFTNVTGTGVIHYTANFDKLASTNAFTSNITFSGNTLQINYNGTFIYQDQSQQERKAKEVKVKSLSLKKNKLNNFKNLFN